MTVQASPVRLLTDPQNEIPPPPPSSSTGNDALKKGLVYTFLLIVAAVVMDLSYYWFKYSENNISTDNSYIEADIWPVNSHNMGFIKQILVTENQVVKKGQLMLLLDDSDVQIELKYKAAKLKKALDDEKRARFLGRSKMVSASDLEAASAGLTAMQSDYDGSVLKEEFTHVYAGTNGIVSNILVHPGQFVQPGQNLMLVVADTEVWVKANYKETDLRKVQVGMPVEFEVDAYPGEKWKGRVQSIYPVSGANLSLIPPENATGNFTKIVQRIPVKISIENNKPGKKLTPGMSVVSTIIVR